MLYMPLAQFFAGIAASQEALHGIAYAAYPLLNILFLRKCVAETKMLLATTINVKWLANDEANLLVCSLSQERTSAQIDGQAAPEMKPARRMADPHFAWPVRSYSLKHQVTFTLVALA